MNIISRRLLSKSTLQIRNMASQRAPLNLVSVNTSPDRAKNVINQVIDRVKDKYTIVHVGNSESELYDMISSIENPVHPPVRDCELD